jgi:hypothetical protein
LADLRRGFVRDPAGAFVVLVAADFGCAAAGFFAGAAFD